MIPTSSPSRRFTLRRGLLAGLILLLLLLAGAALTVGIMVRRSLPRLDGTVPVAGVAAPVRVERDSLGVVRITASSRLDAARATGWVHAQDRFFQMDLLRRRAAGELAALVGPGLLEVDRDARRHRFRARAGEALDRAAPGDRALLEAYAAGVNAGLEDLGARPFEYLILRSRPRTWLPEDSFLILFAMYLDLNDAEGTEEATLGAVERIFPPQLAAFLAPRGSEWDAAVDGSRFPEPPIPGPEVLDLREPQASRPEGEGRGNGAPGGIAFAETRARSGSNNWAVSGSAAGVGGSALLANDMHLGLAVPNIWYRAEWTWTDPRGTVHRAAGVTLPGAPLMVAGSNGQVAWGFTNSYGDWIDLVLLEPDPGDPSRYRTATGWREFEDHVEIIEVAGAGPDTVRVRETIHGPLLDRRIDGGPVALAWIAHRPEGVNLGVRALEDAGSVEEALDRAGDFGVPPLNLVVADAQGHIGWTVAGAIPLREGFDGRVPVSWSAPGTGWVGWLTGSDRPRIVDPPSGRLWTANARVVGGEMLARLGDGGYALGARAGQIRDALLALDRPGEADMLQVQLDDRALFLERWRRLLTEVLDRSREGRSGGEATPSAESGRDSLSAALADWDGHASVRSAAYRLVRHYRYRVRGMAFSPFDAILLREDPRSDLSRLSYQEGPLWSLVTAHPPHLLDPRFPDWEALLLAAADSVVADLAPGGPSLRRRTWGERNVLQMKHPLSYAIPPLARWLDMAPEPLPGDFFMPRVQTPGFGASQRLVVAPGREATGILHMPGGQSGHPLSPYHAAGHEAWVLGHPAPLLAGPAVHTLTLEPENP